MDNAVVANVFGTLGAVLWSLQVRVQSCAFLGDCAKQPNTALAPNMEELEATRLQGLIFNLFPLLGHCWCAARCVQHCRRLQCCSPDSTKYSHTPQSLHVVPVQILR